MSAKEAYGIIVRVCIFWVLNAYPVRRMSLQASFLFMLIRRAFIIFAFTLHTHSLPLHCIGLNRDLILLSTCNVGASIARVDEFILKELLPAYPSAVINEDEEGRIPFTEVILKWITARRAVRLWKTDLKKKRAERYKRRAEDETRRAQARLAKRYSVTPYDDDDEYGDDYAAYMENPDEDEDEDDDDLRIDDKDDDVSVESLGEDVMVKIREVCGEDEEDEDDEEIHDLPPLVEWSLRMLSSIIDQPPNELGCAASNLALKSEMNGHDSGRMSVDRSEVSGIDLRGGKRGHRQSLAVSMKGAQNMVFDDIVVEKLATIPHLVEELLLIEDKAARARVFELSIVHKVLFMTESLGDGKWLVNMLNKGIHAGAHVNVYITTGNRHDPWATARASVDLRQGSMSSMDSARNLNLAWGGSKSNMSCRQGSMTSLFTGSRESGSKESQVDKAAKVVGGIVENEGYKYAEAGVFYLEAISNLNIQDDLHVLHHLQMMQGHLSSSNIADMIGRSDLRHFRKKRDALYDTIGCICGLIRILCVLDGDLVARATVTPVVQRALDKRIFSPFAMTIAVIDGIIHFLLILSFRLGTAPCIVSSQPNGYRLSTLPIPIFEHAALYVRSSLLG